MCTYIYIYIYIYTHAHTHTHTHTLLHNITAGQNTTTIMLESFLRLTYVHLVEIGSSSLFPGESGSSSKGVVHPAGNQLSL